MALLRSGADAQLRSDAVAQCAVFRESRMRIEDLLRYCCALQKGEGGGESENVEVRLPLRSVAVA